MSKVRNLPSITSLDDEDLLYAVDESAGPNGGRKINKADFKETIKQSPTEIKVSYESNPDTNAFTDAEKAKLATVEAGAAFQDASEVPYSNTTSGLSATDVQDAIDEVNVKAQADFRPSIVSGRILHYSGGTARFDDVFYQLVANDILLNPSVTNGEVYVDLDGLVKQTGSGITAPPLSIVFAKFSTDLNDITSLTDERVKNTQNLVRGTLADVRDVRAGAAAQEGTSGRLSDAMHKHNILTAAAATQTPDQANAEGVSVSLARADHVHNIPAAAPTINLSPATTNAEGVGSSFARNDHTHAVETALVGDITTVNAGDAASAGTVDRFARGDHEHAVATGTPSSQTPDQANAEGVSTDLARADHIHNIPADAPTTTLSPATTNDEGVGSSFARNDHTHAVATGLVGDLTTIQPDDAAAAGTVDRFARADHRHAIVAAAPSSQAPDQANAEGASTSFARADHIHNIPADAPTTTLSPATSNSEGVGSSFARNDHTHAVATALVGDITTIQPDATASAGVANTFARGDHRHAIDAAAPATQTPDQANAEGVSTSFARADHVHNVPAGTPGTTLSPATSNAKGVAASFALSDHTHAVATALVGDITTIQPDAAAAAGTANTFARGDHRHAIDAAAPTTTLSPATTNAEGSGTSFSRNDHTHAVATGLVGDLTTIQPDDAAAAGTVDRFARADHRHAIVADTPVDTGTANAEGNSTSFARANHVHNTTIANSVATATADDTTTSVTDVLIAGMTLTPAAGTYLATFSSSVLNSGNGALRLFVSIYSAGAQVTHSEREIGIAGGANVPVYTNAIVTVNGSQAIEARWRAVAGTNTAHERSLTLIRLGS